jgi:hypothetical protein
MSIGVLFWVLMILWLLFGFFYNTSPSRFGPYGWAGNSLLLFILMALLGWEIFGPALHR